MIPQRSSVETDVLVVGGGAAGCAAAVELRERAPQLDVTVVEKAHVSRSGCLAMGINAVNAYLLPGASPDDFVDAVRRDAHGVVREDLVRSIAAGVNEAAHRVESWGLPIPRDASGSPVAKGPRSIRILGESLKPILARRLRACGARVINRHALLDLKLQRGRVSGAHFLGVRSAALLEVRARAVILATGGAAGLYRTPNRGPARSRMWYCPYNTGAGYAAALRAGAELTTLEMRFIPTRLHWTAAPTGTLAQTFGAITTNLLGEEFFARYARLWGTRRLTTPQRLQAIIEEWKAGRGPAELHLAEGGDVSDDVLGAYLDMAPSQVALWVSQGFRPGRDPVVVSTSGPYVLGGHTASGLWVDGQRRATLAGLYAAGDVAGGAPKKYVSGAWVEGFTAARAVLADLAAGLLPHPCATAHEDDGVGERAARPLQRAHGLAPRAALDRLQQVMDEFAGGISTLYALHGRRLERARRELAALDGDLDELRAGDPHELLEAAEVRDRVLTARALVEHLDARTETRWPGYQSRVDFPCDNPSWKRFVNSRLRGGRLEILTRPLTDHRVTEEGDLLDAGLGGRQAV